MRIALGLEYDGSRYHGWQEQPGLHTVQGVLEAALSRVADERVSVVAAGRTDTGVHATAQVIHFDTTKERAMRAWVYGANSWLPKDVSVKWAREIPETFNARQSALFRRYQYFIYNTQVRPALHTAHLTWQYRPLDCHEMNKACQYLLGENDFTSFRSVECQSKTPMRNIMHLEVKRRGDLVLIDVTANAFLHHMVRNIAGVLMAVGARKKAASWVSDVLIAKDRKLGAETAPPYGLYLVDVTYPSEFGLPKNTSGPFFLSWKTKNPEAPSSGSLDK